MKQLFIATCLLVFCGINPVGAHHSFAMFDASKETKVEGTVKELQWVNPHAFLQLVVMDSQNQPKELSLEMGSTGQMKRAGLLSTTIKSGDRITVVLRPLKSGAAGGQVVMIQLASGKTICFGQDLPNGYKCGPTSLDPPTTPHAP